MFQTQSVRAAPAASRLPAGERFSRWEPIAGVPWGPARLVELRGGADGLAIVTSRDLIQFLVPEAPLVRWLDF